MGRFTAIWVGGCLRLLAVLAVVLAFIRPVPVVAAPAWLDYLNSLRANANLPALTENAQFSADDFSHARYMVLNNKISHDETPGNPGYSAAGNTAGLNSDVAVSSGDPTWNYQNAIDGWMTGPFHAAGIIDPRLAQTGFGIYTDFSIPFPQISAGAALNTNQGRTASPTYPVFFPGNNKQMPYTRYDGFESPNPLSACAGYTAPTGPPLMMLFASTPTINAVTLTRDGTPGNLSLCYYTETTYTNSNANDQGLARNVLAARHAVVVMPQQVFTNGIYHLTVNNNGTIYSILFGVGVQPHALQSIAVTPANTTVPLGASLQMTATGSFSDGTTQDLTGSVVWSASPGGIVTVATGGLVTPVTEGSVTITATSGSVQGSTTLHVIVPPAPLPRPGPSLNGILDPAPTVLRGGTSNGGIADKIPVPR